jgi:hypothetical protein
LHISGTLDKKFCCKPVLQKKIRNHQHQSEHILAPPACSMQPPVPQGAR